MMSVGRYRSQRLPGSLIKKPYGYVTVLLIVFLCVCLWLCVLVYVAFYVVLLYSTFLLFLVECHCFSNSAYVLLFLLMCFAMCFCIWLQLALCLCGLLWTYHISYLLLSVLLYIILMSFSLYTHIPSTCQGLQTKMSL